MLTDNQLSNNKITVRPSVGRKPGTRYTYLALEIERLTGVDRQLVTQVLLALPDAILAMFDRGDRFLKLTGLGAVEYRYRQGDSSSPSPVNRESRWQLVIRPERRFQDMMRSMLGRPVKFRETYIEGLMRRREIINERYKEIGAEAKFNNQGDKSYT